MKFRCTDSASRGPGDWSQLSTFTEVQIEVMISRGGLL